MKVELTTKGDPPASALLLGLLLLFFLGGLLGVALHGDLPRLADPAWWRFPARLGGFLIPPEPSAHLAYALFQIAPRNLLIVLAAGLLVPRLSLALLGDPWPTRAYALATAFAGGLAATPGGLPHGGAYLLAVFPVVLVEYAAYAHAAWEGTRAAREGRPPRLALPLALVLLGALLETEVIAWLF